MAGIVAVDFEAKWYQNRINQLGTITGGFTVLACIFSLCLSAIIAARFRKSFMHLYKKMNDLSEGIETLATNMAIWKCLTGQILQCMKISVLFIRRIRIGEINNNKVDPLSCKNE